MNLTKNMQIKTIKFLIFFLMENMAVYKAKKNFQIPDKNIRKKVKKGR